MEPATAGAQWLQQIIEGQACCGALRALLTGCIARFLAPSMLKVASWLTALLLPLPLLQGGPCRQWPLPGAVQGGGQGGQRGSL